jgi:hypothetical protein
MISTMDITDRPAEARFRRGRVRGAAVGPSATLVAAAVWEAPARTDSRLMAKGIIGCHRGFIIRTATIMDMAQGARSSAVDPALMTPPMRRWFQ